MTIFEVEDVSKHFFGVQALRKLSFSLEEGKITGLIGSNGAGKTTIFNIITGFVTPDEGRISFKGENITGLPPISIVAKGICRTFQELRLFKKLTVLENILLAISGQSGENVCVALFGLDAYRKGRNKTRQKAEEILNYVGLAKYANTVAEDLAYGEQKLLSFGRLLATDADLLLLDEPTSGLDGHHVEQILAIINKLAQDGKTICLIEHNMEVIIGLSHWIYVLDQGSKIAEGCSTDIMNDPKVLSLYLGEGDKEEVHAT